MANHNQPETFMGVTKGSAIVRLSHVQCTATALTQTFTWAELRLAFPRGTFVPANALLMSAKLVRHTDFSGGAVSAASIDLGDAAAPTEIIAAADVFTGAKATASMDLASMLDQYEAEAYVPQIVLTVVGANVDQLTAGDISVAIQYEAHSIAALV